MTRTVVALSTIVLAVVFQSEAHSYPMAAARLPILVSWTVIALAVLMILETVTAAHRAGSAVSLLRPALDRKALGRSALFVALVLAYAAAIEPMGYFVATPLYLIATLTLFRAASPRTVFAVAIGITLVIWVVFVTFLNLPIPLLPELWTP